MYICVTFWSKRNRNDDGLGGVIRSSDAKNMKPDSDVLSNYAQWIVTNVSEERVALELFKICSQ